LCDGYLKGHTKYRKIQIIGLGTGIQSRNFIGIADQNGRFLEICSSDQIKKVINCSLIFDKKTVAGTRWRKIDPGPGISLPTLGVDACL
jgi:hypothetical protein